MNNVTDYSATERTWLWAVAALGFVALNTAFLISVLFRPDDVMAVMTNPLAAVFVVEALVMVGVLAYLLQKWQVTRLHWGWFVLLSLVGSLAFALPVAILWGRRSPAT